MAQNVAINNDGSPPNPNAILDVQAKNKGILVPRMDSITRQKIAGPIGLLVFDSTTRSFWYHNGKSWQNMAAPASWLLNGNNNIDDSFFLGTTDSKPLTMKVNNQLAGYIDANDTKANTLWGYSAGSKISSGIYNTADGFNTLVNNTIGSYNTALGSNSMTNNTQGSGNTAAGSRALFANTSGASNVAIGDDALISNTTGSSNTAVGTQSLVDNLTGQSNTAIGMIAMNSNTTGNSNVAIGFDALGSNQTASNNTACGYFSLVSNTTGQNNVALGFGSMLFNLTSNENTASGYNALFAHRSGDDNTAIGSRALTNDTSGFFNTAIGKSAMFNNTNGVSNTVAGWNSLFANTEGGDNTAFGIQSLRGNTTGHYNTAIGSDVMWTNTTGQFNTVLGYFSDVSASNLNNATAIGAQAIVNASNKVRIGNTAVTVIEGQVPFTNPSDGRFKFNIQEDVKGLDFILRLRPVTYQFDVQKEQDFVSGKLSAAQLNNNIHQASYNEAGLMRRTGFIAQEVEQAAEKSNYDFDGLKKPNTDKDYYSLSYASFVVPLVKAMQEQQKIIDVQQKKITEQQQLYDALMKRLDTLEKDLHARKNNR
jgi:hypothetical protein